MTHESLPPVRGLAEGRPEAFAELYDRHAAAMFAVARAICGRRADAEDAMQQTFVELYQSRQALARAHSLRAYVCRAVRNTALRTRARPAPEALKFDPVSAPSAELDSDLQQALQGLPQEQREVVVLKTQAELSFEELGELLGISPNTAASRYRYALEKLRQTWKP